MRAPLRRALLGMQHLTARGLGPVVGRMRGQATAWRRPSALIDTIICSCGGSSPDTQLFAIHRPVRVSARRNLINAWRVTPMRFASLSIARNKSTGKSTFTRWTSRAGLRALSQATCSSISSEPASNSSSNFSVGIALVRRSAAFVFLSLACSRPPDRDDADCFFMTIRNTCGPRGFANAPHHDRARFDIRSRRHLEPIGIAPERLRLSEVDPKLPFVRSRFVRIELERHSVYKLCHSDWSVSFG